MSVESQRWLGDRVSEVCRPGERVVFVAENTAFGGHAVARKLGIGVGVVEGLLLDLNAIDPDSRVDVATNAWRAATSGNGGGRDRAKRRCVAWARAMYGLAEDPAVDAAEAIGIATWWSNANPGWGSHVRPIPALPRGIKRPAHLT